MTSKVYTKDTTGKTLYMGSIMSHPDFRKGGITLKVYRCHRLWAWFHGYTTFVFNVMSINQTMANIVDKMGCDEFEREEYVVAGKKCDLIWYRGKIVTDDFIFTDEDQAFLQMLKTDYHC